MPYTQSMAEPLTTDDIFDPKNLPQEVPESNDLLMFRDISESAPNTIMKVCTPAQALIDDTTASTDKAYSSSKVDSLFIATKPKIEIANGVIFDSGHDTVKGLGMAIVELNNGIARVDFDVLITEYSTTSSTTITDVGINRNLLVSLNNRIPLINPGNGICTFLNPNGEFNILEGYGGVILGTNNYWRMGRRYTTNNDYGWWPAHQFKASQVSGLRIKGVCYGTY